MGTIWGLQYLRAVAALSVLLFHAALGAGEAHALGTGGVDIFFVPAGFLMFQLVQHAPSPRTFAWARVRRIVPAYWLVTAIVAGVQTLGLTEKSSFDPAHFIKSLLFIPSFDPIRKAIYPVLIVGWTLNYEMFFYALMTGLTLIPHRLRLPVLCFLFAGVFAANAALPHSSLLLRFYSDPIIVEFAFGGLVSLMWDKSWLPPRGWWLVVSGALVMVAPQMTVMPRFISYGIPAAAILIGMLAEERHSPLPRLRKLKLLGDASYSIYLWHLFVVTATFRLLGVAPPVFAAAVAGGVVIGLLSYWLIERPSMAFLDRTKRRVASA